MQKFGTRGEKKINKKLQKENRPLKKGEEEKTKQDD